MENNVIICYRYLRNTFLKIYLQGGLFMKKIIVPFKDEDLVLKEVDEKELLNIESGGCFSCYFLKTRCLGFKQLYHYLDKYLHPYRA